MLTRPRSDGIAVTWESSRPGVVAPDGTVTRAERRHEVELTATFARAGRRRHRPPVNVRAQSVGDVVAYVRSGNTTKTEVLHLAAAATAARSSH